MSTSQDKELKRIMDSTDPCAVHVRGYICTVPATETKAEHTAIKIECLLCKRSFAWSSWVRVRGHLSGDGTMVGPVQNGLISQYVDFLSFSH